MKLKIVTIINKRIARRMVLALIILSQYTAYSQTYIPGNSYFGRNNYIEYIAGNFPLIISVPHGGSVTPAEIPNDRTCGDATVTDSYTLILAKEIRDEFNLITGCYPHIIICNLKRTKLDANRDLAEAACGNEFAEIAWNEYHKFIDSAKAIVTRNSGKGLYIDRHGHGHSIQRLELGYLLSATQLSYSDAVLNTLSYINLSSIRNLIISNINSFQHSELLHGNFSLGSLFSMKGFPSVPSSSDPNPLSGESYFNGGYNTVRHGSRAQGAIDGIQIECHSDVRFNETNRKLFAKGVAEVTLEYLKKHYFPNLPQTYCNFVGIEPVTSQHFMVYPNPFGNNIYIQNPVSTDLTIYDSRGSVVISQKALPSDNIDLSNLQTGIYLIVLKQGGKILFREKFIKLEK